MGPLSFILTHTGFCGAVGDGYRFIVLLCSAATMPKHCLQIITPCASLSGLNLKKFHAVECEFRCNELIITLTLATKVFLNGAHFFVSCVKCGSNSIKQTDFRLLPACAHVTLPTLCLVTVALVSDSGAP